MVRSISIIFNFCNFRHRVLVGPVKTAGHVSPTTDRETSHAPVKPAILEKLAKQVSITKHKNNEVLQIKKVRVSIGHGHEIIRFIQSIKHSMTMFLL